MGQIFQDLARASPTLLKTSSHDITFFRETEIQPAMQDNHGASAGLMSIRAVKAQGIAQCDGLKVHLSC